MDLEARCWGVVFTLFALVGRSSWAFDLYDLQRLTQNPMIQSIDDLLQALPAEFQETAVLMHHSLSLQDASFARPRAILQNNDATLVFAYNGDPAQAGYNKLEIMNFDRSERRFEFHELSYKPVLFRKDDFKRPVWSDPNPRVCLGCHGGTDPRPNWEPYNQWPGAYGASASGISVDRSASAAIELPHFKKFLLGQLSNPRYQNLRSIFDTYLPQVEFYHLENLSTLNERLSALNMQRVARKIQSLPFYQEYKFAFAGTIFCEREAARFLPADLFLHHKRVTDGRAEWHAGFDGRPNSLWEQLNLLVEAQGESTKLWSMDFNTGGASSASHRFMSPNSDSEDQLLAALVERDPELDIFHQERSPSALCRELSERSHRRLESVPEIVTALSGVSSQQLSQRQPNVRRLMQSNSPPPRMLLQCASCHASGMSDVPPLPFDDLEELRRALTSPVRKFPRGRFVDEIQYRLSVSDEHEEAMPPQSTATQSERAQLFDYFESLAAP